jgi:hypothetical protein
MVSMQLILGCIQLQEEAAAVAASLVEVNRRSLTPKQ